REPGWSGRLGREGGIGAARERQVQIRGAARQRLRAAQVVLRQRIEERRRGRAARHLRRRLAALRLDAAGAGGDAFVEALQLAEREGPARALVLYGWLHHGQRARVEPGTLVLERAGNGWRTRKSLLGQKAADLEVRVDAGLDAPEQLQHVAIVQERQAVALIAAPACPPSFGFAGL